MLRKKPDPSSKTLPSSSIFSDSSNARFFYEIEALSKALAVDPKINSSSKNQRRLSLPLPSDPKPDPKPKPSSSSIWSWKPLKALAHIRHRRFNCTFSLRVHSIESLPPPLKSSAVVVHWKRASDPSSSAAARTRPAKAFHGSVQFEETLNHRCSVYASRGGPHQPAKYEPRHFLIYVTLAGSTGFDFGKQRVELTRILPVTLEELLEGEKAEGEWSTSFPLSGRARGATLNVSFGYSIGDGGVIGLRRSGSVRVETQRASSRPVLREVMKQDSTCDSLLAAEVLPEMKCCNEESECDDTEFTVIEQGVELESRLKDDAEVVKAKEVKEEEEELAFQDLNLEGLETLRTDFEQVRSMYTKSRSLSLDDVAESVEAEFLSLLGLENSSGINSESPKEKLWRQFEKESLIGNEGILGYDEAGAETGLDGEDLMDDFDLASIVRAAEMEQELMNGKSRAQMLEDAETEALMREWGLDEKLFESSLTGSGTGFGSPIHLPPEESPELPPLGENLGPFLQTKDGGFLRSMSPSLFTSSKNSGSLVMQASSPVVMPAEMGSDVMEILQALASVGIEKLSMQASKLLPLEDFTGKTMQQVAWEAAPSLESCESQEMLEHLNLEATGRPRKHKTSKFEPSRSRETCSEYVSLEDLAPLAMDKIEALSIEGLRIQSGLSDEDAPSSISPHFVAEISDFEGKGAKNKVSIGMEGAAGLHLLDVKDDGNDVDGLMGLSITLDEWMRLDSGVVDGEDEFSERTAKILAAHHAKSTDFHGGRRGGKGKRWGLLGNDFTVALMVQLRDPLRNYEPVGTPMLALIQVERVFIPPKPKIYDIVSERRDIGQDDDDDGDREPEAKEEIKVEEDAIPQFKIAQVHVAGLKTEPNKKELWGNKMQEKSGSRWLLANGMGKSNKNPFVKSNAVSKPSQATSNVQSGDTLWSISSRVQGTWAKWRGLAEPNPHKRNPNVILSSK